MSMVMTHLASATAPVRHAEVGALTRGFGAGVMLTAAAAAVLDAVVGAPPRRLVAPLVLARKHLLPHHQQCGDGVNHQSKPAPRGEFTTVHTCVEQTGWSKATPRPFSTHTGGHS